MIRGDRLTLTVERPAAGGRMIARHDGLIVFVTAAIPGEVVEAEVEKVQRGIVWASTTRVIDRSPDRVEAHDGSCGGNLLAHVRYERQLPIKRDIVRDAFRRLGHLSLPEEVPILGSRADGYRMRARLHYRAGQLGFFREGTHAICDAALTRQLLPETLDVVRELEAALATTPPGAVREVEISENCAASERACHLDLAPAARWLRPGSLAPIAGLRGVSSSPSDHPEAREIWGTPVVADDLDLGPGAAPAAVRVARHARSFFQGNRYLLGDLVRTVSGLVHDGPVLDLYAGVGLFALVLAAIGAREVTAVEADRSSAGDLRVNAAPFGNVQVHQQPVETFVRAGQHVDPSTVIVDPPRTGISRPALQGIVALAAPRIVYVSCDVATLARDARVLADAGYGVTHLQLFDLFPNTAHVESVVVFDRR